MKKSIYYKTLFYATIFVFIILCLIDALISVSLRIILSGSPISIKWFANIVISLVYPTIVLAIRFIRNLQKRYRN